MTDLAAAGLPAQRTDSDSVLDGDSPLTAPGPLPDAVSALTPDYDAYSAYKDEPTGPFDRFHSAADRVQDTAGEVVDKVGQVAQQAAATSGRVAAHVVDRLRNNAELPADRGTTTIADEVVEKITGIAAREVPGVYDLGGDVARALSAVKERVGLGEADADQGVSVRLDGRTAAIKVVIVIEFGAVVYTVAEGVRTKVIESVEHMLGLEVTAVDIVVDDVHIPDATDDKA
jgi:uncharacterized alkaline shock family protein YloU